VNDEVHIHEAGVLRTRHLAPRDGPRDADDRRLSREERSVYLVVAYMNADFSEELGNAAGIR